MRNLEVTVHAVLAGAYGGPKRRGRATDAELARGVTHASVDGGDTSLCGRVKPGHLCDLVEEGPPTCKVCLARMEKRHAEP